MNRLRLFLVILTLMAGSLACNLSSARNATPTPETIVVSTEAVGSLMDKVQAAEEQAQGGGEIEVKLTEEEVTSLVALELQKEQPQFLTNIQIHLNDGKVQISGDYIENNLNLPLSVIAQPEVTAEKGFRIVMVSANVGPVSAPDIVRDQIQEMIDNQISTIIFNQTGTNFVISSVVVADGTITIIGHIP